MTVALDFRPILFLIGILLMTLGMAMALPALVDAVDGNPDWRTFAAAAALTVFVGVSLTLANRGSNLALNRRQGFLFTTLAWVLVAAFAALPLSLSELRLSYTDAYFEAMSGLTTTGATVIVGLDRLAPGLHLWRALLHYLGGIGIVVMAVAMLPFLRVGGMQLFKMESSDTAEKSMPQVRKLATSMFWIYTSLVVFFALGLWLLGMTPLEAFVHSAAALSTGGFSTSDASVAAWPSPAIHWLLTLAMLAGGAPFVLYVRCLMGHWRDLVEDSQLQNYLYAVCGISLVVAGWLWLKNGVAPADALRLSFFNVVSVLTTTGFATDDYGRWGALPVAIFFFLLFAGACTGSTTGAIKIFRFEVVWLGLRAYLWRLVYRHGVRIPRYNGRPVADDVFRGVNMFILTYLAATAAMSLLLALMGIDLVTAVTAVAATIGNVGPGLGEIVGPAGNFATLPAGAKWVCSFAMLLGRLELFTVLVLFAPTFWRG